jgi:endo-1,4-beta-xylanase
LDKLATLGLPIWITEFHLAHENVAERAALIEDALRLFYSHPAVEGIIFWGFWSEADFMKTIPASLVDGKDFVVSLVVI